MFIIDAEITGFKLHKSKRAFTFGKVNRIGGGNGKGKTTISEGIAWCFFGCDLTGKTKDIFDRLKNATAKETKIRINADLPLSDGTLARYEFCRIRKGKVTSLFLNGQDAKQADFDALLRSQEQFLSIFIPGYFGTIAITEPTKARNMLVSMLPKLNHADVIEQLSAEDQVRIEALDMVNPDFTLKNLRSDISELDKGLENVKGKIDYLRISSMLDVPMRVVKEDEKKMAILKSELAEAISATKDKPVLQDLGPLQEKKARLRFQYDERTNEFKELKEKPLPVAGDRCPSCKHAHTEEDAAIELAARKSRLLELQGECEELKQDGYQLLEEINRCNSKNAAVTSSYEAERERTVEAKQAEIEALTAIVAARAQKLKMASDLDLQHEVYGEMVSERDEKKVDVQAVKNFMLQYAEMQVIIVNSHLHMARIQLFKYAGTTGEMTLDFTIQYGENRTEYKALSTSEKIRCSIELAGLLNKVQNISYPVYIDNAESIEDFDAPVTQYFVASVVKKAALFSEIVA